MAEPRITFREHTPEACPHCGSKRIGPVRNEDLEVAPVDPDAATAYPGVLECRDCGAIVQWEP